MSFNHYTFVGHFDPRTVSRHKIDAVRPISPEGVAALLAEYPAEVAAHVKIQNGYVSCQWAPMRQEISEQVFEFAYRLARQEQCLAVENGRTVAYPPAAARAQGEAWEKIAGHAGIADQREQFAQSQAEAFDKRLGRT
jgi:hypothetical protein